MSPEQWHHALEAFQQPLNSDAGMVQYVIYDRPKDAPEHYVVRRWEVLRNGSLRDCEAFGYKRLEDARKIIPSWATCVNRMPGDDPAILEVWI